MDSKFPLPDDRRDSLVEATKREFQISPYVEARVQKAQSLALWITPVLFGLTCLTLHDIWGLGAVLLFLFTIFPAAIVYNLIYALLLGGLQRKFAPGYSDFEYERDKRVERARQAYEREIMATADYWQSLSGLQFEIELAKLLTSRGFYATVTKGSNDGGIDIVARSTEGRIAIQCKRYAKPVGPAVIRELYGVVTADRFDLGILAVTGGVTKGVTEFIKGKPLRVFGLSEIVSMQMELNEAESAPPAKAASN